MSRSRISLLAVGLLILPPFITAVASNESPSSTLDWASALRAATAARLMVQGSSLLTVMPTGSMEPTFNERAILITEPARFEDLKVGDVVAFMNPRLGDANGRMDDVYVTRDNYKARVFGIIYAREPSEEALHFSAVLAER